MQTYDEHSASTMNQYDLKRLYEKDTPPEKLAQKLSSQTYSEKEAYALLCELHTMHRYTKLQLGGVADAIVKRIQ